MKIGKGALRLMALGLAVAATAGIAHAQTSDEVTRYNNLWEISGGFSYLNTPNGPSIPSRASLGGVDVNATQWLTHRWGVTGNIREYLGLGNALSNPHGVNSPLIKETLFAAGPEYRLLRNPTVGLDAHALAGGAYGSFDGHVPATVADPVRDLGIYPNGGTFAVIAGMNLDLNRTPKIAIRISPNYVMTGFGSQKQQGFSLSAGFLMRFGRF